MKKSSATWLFFHKIVKKYNRLPSPAESSILLEFGVVDNKGQTNLIN